MFNKTPLILLVLFASLMVGCRSSTNDKGLSYSDFQPEEFYEVEGRVLSNLLSFSLPRNRVLNYEYFLDQETPLVGYELNIHRTLKPGERFIVLVHKQDSTVSFFGYVNPMLLDRSIRETRKVNNQD